MKKLILIRHGESEWNKLNLFTGWTNVDLSEKGVQEAIEAGKVLKENGYKPEICFTSYLKRAIKTLNLALEADKLDGHGIIGESGDMRAQHGQAQQQRKHFLHGMRPPYSFKF